MNERKENVLQTVEKDSKKEKEQLTRISAYAKKFVELENKKSGGK